ncbi:aminotransferase class V-fold PLP-dependent enzyme [Limoniibacter endophyticus]|uniref:Aminotransferase class V n=1 Tax=Limoniibacter endophyticus TaxID=1565040 RepID=A0A8J3GGW1_9HYPH|nr:aminotransferase class V-fold PLP-dependent enzyme [Limoniibacter endophyticus]GHC67985.1 aminotransferase class V [Limoniibacter endophyticus]
MFDGFKNTLQCEDLIERLRAGVIGEGVSIDGPAGPRKLVYADYVASGRALQQIEQFVMEHVLPYYANSHTEASFCGAQMTRMRAASRQAIADDLGAGDDCSVIFAGSGATAGMNKLVLLLDIPGRIARGEKVAVLSGPYEHHSNILPWRECGAPLFEIPECAGGGPCLDHLERKLKSLEGHDLVIGTFSAASNVTGIVTDTDAVSRILKRYGAVAIWDYAGGGPYMPMQMRSGTDCARDAIVFSPHKFPGGPGASGVLMLRNEIVRIHRPTMPGGGSVTFVSPWDHDYSSRITAREEAGTPNVIGDIRAGLALMIKHAIGQDFIDSRHAELRVKALNGWADNPRLELLGNLEAERLPIFSFRVRDEQGNYVHHQLFTRMLSDYYGVQARGGCACAGPYAHRLLNIDEDASSTILAAIRSGLEMEKPGWVRLNFSYLACDEKADFIIAAVNDLSLRATELASKYDFDPATARFRHREILAAAEQSAGQKLEDQCQPEQEGGEQADHEDRLAAAQAIGAQVDNGMRHA